MWSPLLGSGVVAVGAAVAAPHEGLLTSPASLTFELSNAKIRRDKGKCTYLYRTAWGH